jgi:hypothetical protein
MKIGNVGKSFIGLNAGAAAFNYAIFAATQNPVSLGAGIFSTCVASCCFLKYLSDGQFDKMFEKYKYDTKTESFKVEGSSYNPNGISLFYNASLPKDNGQRDFKLGIYNNGRLVDNVSGVINKKGDNEEYYAAVDRMRRAAMNLHNQEQATQ